MISSLEPPLAVVIIQHFVSAASSTEVEKPSERDGKQKTSTLLALLHYVWVDFYKK